jgi:Steigviridae/Suoliviridae L,D-carboxypeptidase/transpeptidase
MDIVVDRLWPSSQATTGVLSIDGKQTCFTLEPPIREMPGVDVAEWKIKGISAIPRGRYQVKMQESARFGHPTPHLQDVPGFTEIEIHGGNTAKDTEGCILVAEKRLNDFEIYESEPAINDVYTAIQAAEANGEEIWITVQ